MRLMNNPQDNLEKVAKDLEEIYDSALTQNGGFQKLSKHFEGEKNKVRIQEKEAFLYLLKDYGLEPMVELLDGIAQLKELGGE